MNNQIDPQIKKSVNSFKNVAVLEGISFLVLLFIAMPLKYGANWPWGVKYVGWVHGALFVLYMLRLVTVTAKAEWKFKQAAWAFAASIIPFGTFVLEKQLKKQYDL